MAMIPANDLRRQFELQASEYEEKAVQVLRSGWYILGNEVRAFEEAFAAYAIFGVLPNTRDTKSG